jgi:serine/threonine-protein kinase HipA
VSRELDVFLGDRRVGRLVDVAGIWSFEYLDDWRAGGYELSPGLPLQHGPIIDRGRTRPVQWFFEHLLPPGALAAGPLAGTAHDVGDSWHLIETLGEEAAGAIRLRPPADRPAGAPVAPPGSGALRLHHSLEPHLARPVVVDSDGRVVEEAAGDFASTHFLIPDTPDDLYPASTANAWYCARVARELGFDVAAVELRFMPDSDLLVERFDRRREGGVEGGRIQPRHVIDGAQLLSLPAGTRPAPANAQALCDIVLRSRAKAPTRIALFRWTVFNVLVGDLGAHLNRLAFTGGPEGYALAPHGGFTSAVAWLRPELQPAESILPDVALPHPIGGATRYAELRRSHLVAFGLELGLPEVSITRELDRLAGRIAGAADHVLAEYDARRDVPRRLRAGQRRLIATIRNMPIAEMSRRLMH